MAKLKSKIEIDSELCKGCKLCVNVCAKKCIELSKEINSRSYHYAVQVNPDACVGCKLCAYTCPDGAIEVYREVQ